VTQNLTDLVVNQSAAQSGDRATGPTWERLMLQRHADYDPDLWKKLKLLYDGGFAIQENASLFLERVPGELEKYYKWRCKTTAYLNHMSRVIGHLIGGLFGVPLKVGPAKKDSAKPVTGGAALSPKAPSTPDDAFYKRFSLDCDLKGTDFSQFMRDRLVHALIQKRSLIGIDLPVGVAGAANRAQEEAQGAGRAWLYELPLEAMLDWECDDKGRYQWCKLVKKVVDRSDPLGDHGRYFYEFKIWRLMPDPGSETGSVACYETYRTQSIKDDSEIKPEDAVPQVTASTMTSFSSIPIREFCLPNAVWAGNQIGPLCREHYSGRSDLRASMSRGLVELLVLKRGPEIGEVHGSIPSVTQQDPNRGHNPKGQMDANGYVPIGQDDALEFTGPSGVAYQMAADELGRLRDEIFGAMHTMALALANTASTVQRSGESKKEDRSATIVILDFLGDELRECAEMVYDIVSDGRADDAEWEASGVDSYDDDDRTLLIEEATEIGMLNIPSPTFHRIYTTGLACTLVPKASQAVKQAIADEIEKNFTDEMAMPPPTPLIPPPGGGAKPIGGADAKPTNDPAKLPALKMPKPKV
jgi:hypothetical protein